MNTLAGLGMLLSPIPAGISILSAIAAKKNLNKALDIYNQKFEVQPGTQESINLNIGVSPGGLGFIINF
jgi:fructose-1,6-bisphosphatase/sedoheptulose 1,7-bisphosphatase-like protein